MAACSSGVGGTSGHQCTRDPAMSGSTADFLNEGESCPQDCYDDTNKIWTRCPKHCGRLGVCCRKGAANQLEICGGAGGDSGHVCTRLDTVKTATTCVGSSKELTLCEVKVFGGKQRRDFCHLGWGGFADMPSLQIQPNPTEGSATSFETARTTC